MQDLSLHVLDIAENSIAAGATRIEITINEDVNQNILELKFKDNGKGMDKSVVSKVMDPFYTTKKERRVGLGLPLLAQAAREAGGNIDVGSRKGKGTAITATFSYDHIDRKPIGNMTETVIQLIAVRGVDIDFVYKHFKNKRGFLLDTRDIKKKLSDIDINTPEVLRLLRETLESGLDDIKCNGGEYEKAKNR